MKYMYSLACLRFALMKLIVIRYLFEICLEEANSNEILTRLLEICLHEANRNEILTSCFEVSLDEFSILSCGGSCTFPLFLTRYNFLNNGLQ